MSHLVVENLTKSFDGQVVLNDVNIEAPAGELLVVLGPSGCGKSTLLRLISGLEIPDRGKIILDGTDITHLEPQKRKTAMVFQNYALYPHMTVFENIAFPLKVARLSKSEIKKAVEDTADLLELKPLLDRRPAQLSGGQRQRVALGRGLIRQPSIFLLDEPLSNLDATLRLKMRQEIVSLQKRLRITMIYVTHDQSEALTMADKMVVVKDGHLRQTGTPAEIYDHPREIFVASFIGSPAINLFEDRIIDHRGRALPATYGERIADGSYILGIRPEHIYLNHSGQFSGRVLSAEYVGSVVHLCLGCGELSLTVSERAVGEMMEAKTADQLIDRPINFDIDLERVLFFDPATGQRIPTGR